MQPTFFINHGGGPCFFLDPGPMRNAWAELEDYLRGFAETLEEQPRAILVISGHWEEARPTVNSGTAPPLLFDYGGFPEHTYRLTWPALGSPEVAARVRDLLGRAGIESGADATRGWDHGVFVPFKVMFPEAAIPTVQLSLKQGLGPEAHLAIGHALAPLRREAAAQRGRADRRQWPELSQHAWLHGWQRTSRSRPASLRRVAARGDGGRQHAGPFTDRMGAGPRGPVRHSRTRTTCCH